MLEFTGGSTCDGKISGLSQRTGGNTPYRADGYSCRAARDHGYMETVTARMRGREERASKDSDGKDESGKRPEGAERRGLEGEGRRR